MKKKTAVLIHAHFLPPGIWEEVMWGNPKDNQFGVISKGLTIAKEEKVDLIYLCSGIPFEGGQMFSPDVYEFIQERAPQYFGHSLSEVRQDNDAQNTQEEIENAKGIFEDFGISRFFQVSTPKHIMRAHQQALVMKAEGGFKGTDIFAVASDIDFPNAKVADVAIIEPSHRYDTPVWNAHLCAKATIRLMKQGDPVFSQYTSEWSTLLAKYGEPVS